MNKSHARSRRCQAHASHTIALVAGITIGASASCARANEVNIDLSVVTAQPITVGTQVRIDLVLQSSKALPQEFDALGAVLLWDPTKLQLINNDQTFQSATGLYFAGFLPDADLINEVVEPLTPMDGDAYFQGFTVGQTFIAPEAPGEFIATSFIFQALASTAGTQVELVARLGDFGETRVLLFGQDVTGDIGDPVTVIILPPPTGACCTPSGCTILTQADCTAQSGFFYGDNTSCPPCDDGNPCTSNGCNPANGECVNLTSACVADVDPVAGGDGVTNIDDLLRVISAWGPCPAPPPDCCPGNTNGDAVVNIDDLLAVISGWGPC